MGRDWASISKDLEKHKNVAKIFIYKNFLNIKNIIKQTLSMLKTLMERIAIFIYYTPPPSKSFYEFLETDTESLELSKWTQICIKYVSQAIKRKEINLASIIKV